MTLSEAVKTFEQRFALVLDYTPGEDPTGIGANKYFVLTSGGLKPEGEPDVAMFDAPDIAVSAWLNEALKQHGSRGGSALYWRIRPEIVSGHRRGKPTKRAPFGRSIGPLKFRVYSRMTFA